jgi:hypothetical protein
MKYTLFFFLTLYLTNINTSFDYTKEKSWQDRKKYAKKIINFFIKNQKT